MALSNIFVKFFLYKKNFYKILLDYCINSWVCNYGITSHILNYLKNEYSRQ